MNEPDNWIAELEGKIRNARGWDLSIESNRRKFRHLLQARLFAVTFRG